MVKRTLTFDCTLGNTQSRLFIDRTGEIDLTPVFVNIFNSYNKWITAKNERINKKKRNYKPQELPEKYILEEKVSTFDFYIDELFASTLYKHTPEELYHFLNQNMVDPEDYHNEAMLSRLKSFDDYYERLYYIREGNYFMIRPMDRLKPMDIHRIAAPPKNKGLSNKIKWEFSEINKDAIDKKYLRKHQKFKFFEHRLVTTRPYHCTKEDHVIKALQNSEFKDKNILRVYPIHSYFNYFDIITYHNLPKENLEIVFNKKMYRTN